MTSEGSMDDDECIDAKGEVDKLKTVEIDATGLISPVQAIPVAITYTFRQVS
jgi:hypothetical protein